MPGLRRVRRGASPEGFGCRCAQQCGYLPFPFKTLTSGCPRGEQREPWALGRVAGHALGFIADARFECLLLRI